MKYKILAIVMILSSFALCSSAFTLQDAVLSQHSPRTAGSITPAADGENYYKMVGGSKINKISYKTGATVETVFDSSTARDCTVKKWDGYIMSADGSQILLYTNSEPVYRHSIKADYYTFEVRHNKLTKLSTAGGEEIPTFSPDSRMVAYVKDNNVHIRKLDYGTDVAVTTDGMKNKIRNAIPDWVYQEEFDMLNSFCWSPDNAILSFIRFDETDVPLYHVPLYNNSCEPNQDYEKYPGSLDYKYPVAGEKVSKVSVVSYNVDNRDSKTMQLPIDADSYIPAITYAPQPDRLMVTTLNRTQNQLRIYAVNPRSTMAKLAYSEDSESWINTELAQKVKFYDNFFIIPSERSGWTHLYQYSNVGSLMKQLTTGNWNVTDFYGYDPIAKVCYFQSTQDGAVNRSLSKVDLKGVITRMSSTKGTYSAKFSSNFAYYVQRFSDARTPDQYTVCNTKGKQEREMEMNRTYAETYTAANVPVKEFFTMESDGTTLEGYIIKPTGFDPSKKYPVIMSQYSGPGVQQVLNEWKFEWEEYFATQGYVIACVDGRGSGGHGKKYESTVYMHLGKYETIDQLAAARYMAQQSYVDASKIGIWGWSYGGYETLMAMTDAGSKYAAGVAIAPVTDWRLYDAVYAERFMRTPSENEDGYRSAAPLLRAGNLKGKLLLMAGTSDDNVHIANMLQFASELTSQNKIMDMMVFAGMNHSINGCDARYPLYLKVLDFFDKNLK
ncbi:MAG: S9 family peptidase [Muribaculaceae bacterium]|jgi:dipeptidyl-peptidase-4|nr:S9 family peptidase [Muribaculaceae bacterium]